MTRADPDPLQQALTALEFAHGAILDAIGLEDGLDGRAGERVLGMINAALIANGRQPLSMPAADVAVEPLPYWTTLGSPDPRTVEIARLREALKDLNDAHHGYHLGLGRCICAAHEAATAALSPIQEPEQ